MRFGLEGESNNGCVGFYEKTYPLSLDDFNEPCTAVIVKKKNWYAKFLYATHLNAPTWLKWFKIFKNLFLLEYLKKKVFWGLLSTWRPLFTFLWKKRVFVRYIVGQYPGDCLLDYVLGRIVTDAVLYFIT